MKHIGLKVFGGIIAILITGFIILTLSLDGMVKAGIEKNGSDLLKTEVTVNNVSLSIFDGAGSIEGFKVANPGKFSERNAIAIQEASVKVKMSSLFSDQIVVEELIVKNPELYFEQQGFGANLKTLNDNMDLQSEESSEKRLLIEHLLIENGQVAVHTEIDKERTTSVSIESFELNGVGREDNNTVQQSLQEVMEPLLEKAIAEAIKSGVTEQIENKVQEFLNN